MEESEAPNIKQVIVMRHDLKIRRSNAQAWITGSFAKVCVRCNGEEELMAINDKAIELGLEVHLITDSGRTEFHGQPTRTCLAIGPDDASTIDQVTGHLELL